MMSQKGRDPNFDNHPYLWPPKTDLFKKLYIETIMRNPEKVGFSGHRYGSCE